MAIQLSLYFLSTTELKEDVTYAAAMAQFLRQLSYLFMATRASAHVVMQNQKLIIEESVPVAPFGYTKNIDPLSWYGTNPSTNSHCATGSNQSPINIELGNTTMTTVGVWLNISSLVSAEIENFGNTIEVALAGFRRWKGDEGKLLYMNLLLCISH